MTNELTNLQASPLSVCDVEPQAEWDYSLPRCTYCFPENNPRGFVECGEPAISRVRFAGGEWLYLCTEHTAEVEQAQDKVSSDD